jgi:hypothetical protein
MSGPILISGCPKCISNRRSDHECGYWRLIQRQPIQRHDFFPGQLVGGTPAHTNIID